MKRNPTPMGRACNFRFMFKHSKCSKKITPPPVGGHDVFLSFSLFLPPLETQTFQIKNPPGGDGFVRSKFLDPLCY